MPDDVKKNEREQKLIYKVTLLGSVWDLLLGLVKILVGYLSHSQALIADGIHSLSDLLTDFFVLFAAYQSRQAPDKNHLYGHRKFETIATLALGIVLFAVALGILVNTLTTSSQASATGAGLLVLIATLVIKEGLFWYTKNAAEALDSKLLLANAWHSRTDALSSAVVLVGFAGLYMGWQWADKAAAICVALMIANIAQKMLREALAELVDSAPDEKQLMPIRETVNRYQHVLQSHDLRARLMGGKIFLDMHIQVSPLISVSEGHFIGEQVAADIKRRHPSVQDVLIHIDPEDDSSSKSAQYKMPDRNQILADLGFLLRPHLGYIHLQDTRLHYLKQGLQIELFADATALPDDVTLLSANALIQQALNQIRYAEQKRLYWQMPINEE